MGNGELLLALCSEFELIVTKTMFKQKDERKHGIGICNSNGELLLALCSEFELIVTKTMFKQKDERKTTWMKTKTTRILMRELLFADDSALVAHSAEEMQKIVDAHSDASKKFGLKINIKETEVLYQSNSIRTREEDIMVDGNKLNSVLEMTYLGSTISSDGCIDDKIQRRMAKASASFGRLRQSLWNNHHVSMRVKGKMYRAIVLSTLSSTELRLGQCTDDR